MAGARPVRAKLNFMGKMLRILAIWHDDNAYSPAANRPIRPQGHAAKDGGHAAKNGGHAATG